MADITLFLQVACAEELELYPPQARGPAQAAKCLSTAQGFLLKILGIVGSVDSRE